MSDVKQVKVDNWGIYFLQRLKHFFNRTDYCDLTLQFQDNAQLKVHRLVLSACTEYFELLERTCEMYEDCLVMPDDLQADVVVPIVNFMYTGHLEFRMDILERLYQTSQILNMPVLSKLLESHRNLAPKAPAHSYSGVKRFPRHTEPKSVKTITPIASTSQKRSYSKAFDTNIVYRDKKTFQSIIGSENTANTFRPPSPITADLMASSKPALSDPRPTRYEVPEELDTDNIFDNSFCSISYTSQPLMVHPDTVKRYKPKRSGLFGEGSSSKKVSGMSTVDIVECKKIRSKDDSLFDDSEHNLNDENDLFSASFLDNDKDPNQLFDQILDPNDGPKVTIETKDSKTASNLDHARIISEVLKKYPHLVKSNKNIKLKILDSLPNKGKKQTKMSTSVEEKLLKCKTEEDDFTYETDVIDSKQAAKLIAMGAENIKGPWICLICGTPGKALHFNSYYKFRRHLVEVHHEKPVSTICEYCGLKSTKRNYLMHHLYTQHGVPPPPQYQFPKCNSCNYIALTEGLLIKHKLTHKDMKSFRCNVCSSSFSSSNQLLTHIQNTGHKYSSDRKNNLQCIYCLKVFLRETNLCAHIKTNHKKEAKQDCIIEDSDEEKPVLERPRMKTAVKYEPSTSYENEYEEVDAQYQGQPTRSMIEIHVPPAPRKTVSQPKQKILNPGFGAIKPAQKAKPSKIINHNQSLQNEFYQDIKLPVTINNRDEEIVVIDNNEYIMRDHQLIPRKRKPGNTEFIITDVVDASALQAIQQPTTSVEYTNVQNTNIEDPVQQPSSMILKKSANINQPIQIVVSNEEEYKALMASNHPIIFDNGDTNKTLTVLTAPHNQTMETSAIDLDNTQTNEMMILPHEYPLNVTEAVPTENSNIVVVYSHPVDDQNKQYQILTTGGIGAQFVQSSAIITQNYETITTTTSTIDAQCIGTQMQQTWQGNIQSLNDQQIQLPSHTVMQNQVILKAVHNETGNNLDDLPEVHLVTETQKTLTPSDADTPPNQTDVTVERVNQSIEHEMAERPSTMTPTSFIEKQQTTDESVETLPQTKSMPEILANDENIEVPMEIDNVLEQPMVTDNVIEQQLETANILQQTIPPANQTHVAEQEIETHNVLEQSLAIENAMEQPPGVEIGKEQPIEVDNLIEQSLQTESGVQVQLETEHVLEESLGTEDVIEQQLGTQNILDEPLQSENVLAQPMGSENIMGDQTENILGQQEESQNGEEQHVESENVIEQPAESEKVMELAVKAQNELDKTIETEKLTEQSAPIDMESTPDVAETNTVDSTSENLETEQNGNINLTVNQDPESQVYDDNSEVNSVIIEPIYGKQAEEKIQNLTSEWSEDEYDVTEQHGTNIVKNVENDQRQTIDEEPELEESIENIQQEMQKQMCAAADRTVETNIETEESVVSSQEEDTSSQELQLPQYSESPTPTAVQNPQAIQKISSLLNDWEDNDSQEEMNTEPTPMEAGNFKDAEEPANNTDTCIDSETPTQVTKNDNIKSLVSDWDEDDEEESKE